MAKTARKDSRAAALRDWNRILGLWRVCDNAACRRAKACRGNVRACAPVNFAKAPDGVQDWFCILVAAKEDGLSFDEAMAEIEKTPPPRPSALGMRASPIPNRRACRRHNRWVPQIGGHCRITATAALFRNVGSAATLPPIRAGS